MFGKAKPAYSGEIFDTHCHLLPGVDDGASSLAQARSMMTIAAAEGITTIIATPHLVCDGTEKAYAAKIRETFQLLQAVVTDENLPIRLILGYELLLSTSLLHVSNLGEYAIAGSKRLLVETHPAEPPEALEELLFQAELCGLQLILAHPERSAWLANHVDVLKNLTRRGTLLQLNAGSVTGQWGRAVARNARRLAEGGLVHLIGTDAHTDRTRGPYARAALEMLSNWVSGKDLEGIAHRTAEELFGLNFQRGGETYDLCQMQHEEQLLP